MPPPPPPGLPGQNAPAASPAGTAIPPSSAGRDLKVRMGDTAKVYLLPGSPYDAEVLFAPNLSGCAVLIEHGVAGAGARAQQKFDALLNTTLTETVCRHPCWEQFKPKLNPSEADIKKMIASPATPLQGNILHRYSTDASREAGDEFFIYAAPCLDNRDLFIKMQFFVAKMGPPGQVARYAFEEFDNGLPLLDETYMFFTVKQRASNPTPGVFEIISYSEGETHPLFPGQKMLALTSLLTLPIHQNQGHASALVSGIWKYAKTVLAPSHGVVRVHYEPAKCAEEEERQDFEAFALKVHLARMIQEQVFIKLSNEVREPLDIMHDAFRGDPALTDWQKLRESKRKAYAGPVEVDVEELLWSRRRAAAAARRLLLPVSTVRELFEISLYRCLSASTDRNVFKHFILRRIYEMDRVDLETATVQENTVQVLETNYNEAKKGYKELAETAQQMRVSAMVC